MSLWQSRIELRDVNGNPRAFRKKDGREVPIPVLPEEKSYFDWVSQLTHDEVEAARQFYWDRWNWETGDERDLMIACGLEREIEFRERRIRKMSLNSIYQDSGRTTLDLIRQQRDPRNG